MVAWFHERREVIVYFLFPHLKKALPAITATSGMAALTNSGAEVMEQELDTHGEGVQPSVFPLDVMYETQRCVEWIKTRDYQRVSMGVFIIVHF